MSYCFALDTKACHCLFNLYDHIHFLYIILFKFEHFQIVAHFHLCECCSFFGKISFSYDYSFTALHVSEWACKYWMRHRSNKLLLYYHFKHTHTFKHCCWLASGNLALSQSVKTGNPVRVIRGYKLPTLFAPETGYRYDGLYTVTKCW